jgi:Tol biopolymer transport system component
MSLTAGIRLGAYEILGPIGAGGMGEVYRAKDTKLDREVAIKVLPDAWANDPDRLARLDREARALASISHPNIAAIYGVEGHALVMELVEGENLKGPLPVETALNYARQICEALEAAHDKGIIHRDLKPANIKVTPQGVVKVLDFGLATMSHNPEAISGDPGNSPTVTIATQAGLIMGSAAYMSPEQAADRPIDRRADIWSFGVVLWEMLSGRRLFHGESVTHTLADVLRSEIDFQALPPDTPPAIRTLLRRCLDRNVRNRLRDIGEARVAIDQVGQPSSETVPAASRYGGKLGWVIAAVALVVLAALGFLFWRATRPALRPLERFEQTFSSPDRLHSFLALSPDGRRVVFVAKGDDGISRLHVRAFDQAEATPLPGTENAVAPFFSPDGQWLAFGADGYLKKIPLQGGAEIKLCEAPDLRGGSWGEDGNVIFTPGNNLPLFRVSDKGGAAQPITKLKNGEITHRYPQVLPGGHGVLFTASGGNMEDASIQLLDTTSGETKTVYRGGFYARYLPSGHLLWAHQSALFAAVMDLGRAEIKGVPIPIVDLLAADATNGRGNFEVSPAGVVVALTGSAATGTRSLSWLYPQGNLQALSLAPGGYTDLRISPDGQRLAMTGGGLSKADIFLCELERERLFPLTFTGDARDPVWAPDGKHIVFETDGSRSLDWVRADGGGKPERLVTAPSSDMALMAASFSPDGKRLLLSVSEDRNPGFYLWTVSLDLSEPEHPKAGKPEPLSQPPERGKQGEFSPDGRWLAYEAPQGQTFESEIYVEPFPPTGGKWRVASSGAFPSWGRSSPLLFFQAPDGRIMSAAYHAENNSFAAERPQVWAQQVLPVLSRHPFAMALDGKRALVAMSPSEKAAETRLTFLLNFSDELRRRLPGTY